MAAAIKSSYGPYRFAAALITSVKRDPLQILEELQTGVGKQIQFCRPDIVVSERQLVAAFAAAATTTMSGAARSRRIEVEFLLRLSCQTQIQDAIKAAGLKGSEDKIIAAVITTGDLDPEKILINIAEKLGGKIEPFRRITSTENLMKTYCIDETQLKAIPKQDTIDPLELIIIDKVVSSYVG